MCSSETKITLKEGDIERSEPAIRVTGVSKRYRIYRKPSHKLAEALWNSLLRGEKSLSRSFWALTDVDLEVPRGSTMGIIGRNGSGKSTLLQIIAGVLQPTSGEVQVHGRVAALLELGAGFNREFTGRENVFLQGALMDIPKKEMGFRLPEIEAFADIGEFIDQPVKTYSSGMYVRLAFAVAINVDADILIIDEALAVGDDMFRRRCYRRLEELQREGKTILFVTHSMQSVINLCTQAVLIDSGRSIFIGEPKSAVYEYNQFLASLEEKRAQDFAAEVSKSPQFEVEQNNTGLGERRYGNRGAEVLSVTVEDDQGVTANVLTSGSQFTVSMQIVFHRGTKEPVIGFTIKTIKGVEVYGTSTNLIGSPVAPVSAGEALTVRFRQTNRLGLDSYCVSAAVAEIVQGIQTFQDRRLDVLAFKVVGDKRAHGLIDLESEIEISHSQMPPNQE